MEKTGARAADPKGRKNPQANRKESPADHSFDQLEARAETKTEVLVEILARDEGLELRHWGLNE
jgi:hypothetical protein